jgi:methanogenic corrinoid protein MtbC1
MKSSDFVPRSDIEFETGIPKDLLRKWRERYSFPALETGEDGAVGYSRTTVNRLLQIRRLIEAGFRPSHVVGKPALEVERMCGALFSEDSASYDDASMARKIARLQKADLAGLNALLAKERVKGTLSEFVKNTVAGLITAVGSAWSRGQISIYHEHLFSSFIQRLLQNEILSITPRNGPIVLLATVTDEHHGLGLLMAEAILADSGAKCVPLGPNTPLNQISEAALSFKADVVALSFSFLYPGRQVRPTLVRLRQLLPADVAIWAGGAGAAIVKRPPKGVRIFLDLNEVADVLQELRKRRRN